MSGHPGIFPRVCFVAPGAYGALCPRAGLASIGGAEIQQKLLGEALSARGCRVSYVTLDHGQPEPLRIGGLTLYKSYRHSDGIPGLRFLHPRVSGLWRAMARADADVYLVRGAGYLPGLVARFCRRYGRRFIFATASDANVDPALLRLPTVRDVWLYHYGIRRADAIVVQSGQQAAALRRNLGLTGRIIRNIWHGNARALPKHRRRDILWVAMIRDLKQPEHFFRLARRFPGESFVMIGGPAGRRDGDLHDRLNRQAEELGNLRFLGYQPLETVERWFDRARVLVNTSRYEGFPNTFLQAWSRGVPVLSYVNPDRLITRFGLGVVARDEEALGGCLDSLLTWPGGGAEGIMDYFNAHHAPAGIVAGYLRLFRDLGLSAAEGAPPADDVSGAVSAQRETPLDGAAE